MVSRIEDDVFNASNPLVTYVAEGKLEAAQAEVEEDPTISLMHISTFNLFSLLELAAYYGHVHILEWLIKESNYQKDDYHRAFICAVENSQINVLDYLLKLQGSYLLHQKEDESGSTALLVAAQEGCLVVVKWLIHKGGEALITQTNNWNINALMMAAAEGRFPMFIYLVEHEGKRQLTHKNSEGKNILMWMLAENETTPLDCNLRIVKSIIKNAGTSILEATDNDGKTAEMHAVSLGRQDILDYILECSGKKTKRILEERHCSFFSREKNEASKNMKRKACSYSQVADGVGAVENLASPEVSKTALQLLSEGCFIKSTSPFAQKDALQAEVRCSSP